MPQHPENGNPKLSDHPAYTCHKGRVLFVDYQAISSEVAQHLLEIGQIPHELRIVRLHRLVREGKIKIDEHLVSGLIGLINSISYNAMMMSEQVFNESGLFHPDKPVSVNMPTIQGALQGITLASNVCQKKTCATCAYRLGTIANQSELTTSDAMYCVENGITFKCHEELCPEEKFYGTDRTLKTCAGHAQMEGFPHDDND